MIILQYITLLSSMTVHIQYCSLLSARQHSISLLYLLLAPLVLLLGQSWLGIHITTWGRYFFSSIDLAVFLCALLLLFHFFRLSIERIWPPHFGTSILLLHFVRFREYSSSGFITVGRLSLHQNLSDFHSYFSQAHSLHHYPSQPNLASS